MARIAPAANHSSLSSASVAVLAIDSYRPLFLMMAVYTAMAFVAILLVPKGAGEAETGPAD